MKNSLSQYFHFSLGDDEKILLNILLSEFIRAQAENYFINSEGFTREEFDKRVAIGSHEFVLNDNGGVDDFQAIVSVKPELKTQKLKKTTKTKTKTKTKKSKAIKKVKKTLL